MLPDRQVSDNAVESVADIGAVHLRAERENASFERALDGFAIIKERMGDANIESAPCR